VINKKLADLDDTIPRARLEQQKRLVRKLTGAARGAMIEEYNKKMRTK
jgi:hypothetical protein